MQGTLVFVHGTGVREAGFEKTWEAFQKGARRRGFDDIALVACDWGPAVGPDLGGIDASLPLTAAQDPAGVDDTDSTAAWELLIDDPVFELRLAAEAAPRAAPAAAVGRKRPDEAAQDMVSNLEDLEASDADGLLARAGITGDEVWQAAQRVKAAPEFGQAALVAASEKDPEYLEAVSRAIVAEVLAGHRDDPPGLQPDIAFRRELRHEVVDLVARTLFPGATKSVEDWLKRKVVRFVARPATYIAVARRRKLSGLSSAALADILYYQRRGDEIREYVARELHRREPPLIVVGHSLGGVILVDLLSADDAPEVDLLVTVGSQSPLFYAIDALEHLRPGSGVEPFVPWLNIYNEDDLLSYCAERVFAGRDRIMDHRVDAHVPFPESHSAYWAVDDVFDAIRVAAWPDAPS